MVHCGGIMVRLTLRLPDELHGALAADARDSGRSLHSEIVWRLRGGAALREPGIPVSAGGAREAGRPNTAFQASTSGSRSVDEHFKPYPKPGGK